MLLTWVVSATAAALAIGCGADVSGPGGGGSTSTSTDSGTTTGSLAMGQCRGDADCPSDGISYCAPPGSMEGCGICSEPDFPCSSDGDCGALGAAWICTQDECDCDLTCKSGCTSDAGCGPGETCGADARCAPSACAKDGDCPTSFTCSGTCQRKSCTTDAECQGVCVVGQCWEAPGVCLEPGA